jgi:hypothetical protein
MINQLFEIFEKFRLFVYIYLPFYNSQEEEIKYLKKAITLREQKKEFYHHISDMTFDLSPYRNLGWHSHSDALF